MKTGIYILGFFGVLWAGCQPARTYVKVDDDVYYSRKDAQQERNEYLAKTQEAPVPVMKSTEYVIEGKNQDSATTLNTSQYTDDLTNQPLKEERSYFDEDGLAYGTDDCGAYNSPSPYYGGFMGSPFGFQPSPFWTPGWHFSVGYTWGFPSAYFGNPYGYGGMGYNSPFYSPFWNTGWGSYYSPYNYYGFNPYYGGYSNTPGVIMYDNRPSATRTPRTQGNRSLPGRVYNRGNVVPVQPNRTVQPRKETTTPNSGSQPVQPAAPARVPVAPSNQPQNNLPNVTPKNPVIPQPKAPVNKREERIERLKERQREQRIERQERQQRQPESRPAPQVRPSSPAPSPAPRTPAPRQGRIR
ncbi:MAG: hypothetical protein KBB37_08125 [Bacteroidia bacterium]|nr:hypothetical protein [Bacteroidia bacterium]MBP7261239.1 hypothetical protein [Bacteroidia bacterium]MBP9180205.1 hypothetical protein [Bacteroidia bacterium]MBP9725179.1 hypothetical protein [Bacteroidia bacterium]